MASESAGILLYRRVGSGFEVLLAHPGGPFWRDKDLGAWTIPKGLVEEAEDLLATAVREFAEETGLLPVGPFVSLGQIKQKNSKIVHCWACEGDFDVALAVSNTIRIIWPPRSGDWLTIPEVDRCEWFAPQEAVAKINPAQAELIVRLTRLVAEGQV